MITNQCPNCQKTATTFTGFLFSFKTIECQHCQTKLRVESKVVYLLLAMVIIGLAIPTVLVGVTIGFDYFSQAWMNIAAILGYTAVWYLVTSVLAWKVVEFEMPKNSQD